MTTEWTERRTFSSSFLATPMDNRIDAEFDTRQQDAALKALDDLAAALPFLEDLSPEERHDLYKLGDKSRTFVDQALVTAQQFTDALPRSFDVDQYARDVALYRALEPLHARLRDLFERLDDTRMLVGSEAMEGARAVYYHMKGHSGTGALSEASRAMSRRYARGPQTDSGEWKES